MVKIGFKNITGNSIFVDGKGIVLPGVSDIVDFVSLAAFKKQYGDCTEIIFSQDLDPVAPIEAKVVEPKASKPVAPPPPPEPPPPPVVVAVPEVVVAEPETEPEVEPEQETVAEPEPEGSIADEPVHPVDPLQNENHGKRRGPKKNR